MQGSIIQKTSKFTRTPDLYANHIGSVPNSEVASPDNDGEEESRDESESIARCGFYICVLFSNNH